MSKQAELAIGKQVQKFIARDKKQAGNLGKQACFKRRSGAGRVDNEWAGRLESLTCHRAQSGSESVWSLDWQKSCRCG